MKRHTLFSLVALALMAVTGVLVTVPAGGSDVPLRSSFEGIPDVLPGWTFTSQPPGDALPPDTRAPNRLFRGFERGGRPLWVSVEYFPSQDEARRSAARTLIFPGFGWSQIAERRVRLAVDAAAAGRLDANLVLMEGRGGRVAVVYWYQIGQASVASDHWYRARLLYNALVRGRTDGALVRIASPLGNNEDTTVVLARYSDFLREFYPLLLRSLPR
jgi:EpsI family protein